MPTVITRPHLPETHEAWETPSWFRILRAGVLVAALAGTLDLAVYAIALGSGADLVASFEPGALPENLRPGSIVMACVTAAIAATVVYAVLERYVARWANEVFSVMSSLFMVLSLISLLTLSDATVGTRLVLAFMQVIGAIAIVTPLLWTGMHPKKS